MLRVHNPYALAIIASLNGLMHGIDKASISAIMAGEAYQEFFHKPGALLQSIITAALPIGSFFGALFSGPLADRIGRKRTIRLLCLEWCIGVALQCSVAEYKQLIAGRVIAGIAIGVGSSQVPVYITEIAPRHIRGRLVAINQWSITWGELIMFLACFGLNEIKTPVSFRVAWAIQAIPAILLLLGSLWLHESPRWLASKGRWDEAEEVMAYMMADGNKDDPIVVQELCDIRRALHAKAGFSWRKLLLNPINRKRLFIGISAQVWKQLTGHTVLISYVVKIFTMAGYLGKARMIMSSIQFVINVVMTLPALIYIDRWGRKSMMLAGSLLCMLAMWGITCLFAFYSIPLGPKGLDGDSSIRMLIPKTERAAQTGTICLIFFYIGAYACTWAPVSHVYCSELFPAEERAVAAALADSFSWAFNVGLSLMALPALEAITWRTWCIFGASLSVMIFHIFFYYPETKGMSLEDIEHIFGRPHTDSTENLSADDKTDDPEYAQVPKLSNPEIVRDSRCNRS